MITANIPIQLISACSTLGDLTPLWFRFENAEHFIETIKIETVLSHKEEKHCGLDYISYVCSVLMEDTRRLIEVRYLVATHKWSLFRILS